MSGQMALDSQVNIHVRNIGGIDETSVQLSPGVSVLAGRNATNRTSLLRALMAGLGSTRCSLKGDADEGEVTIEIDGETYTRSLKRTGGTVVFGGDPYTDDPEISDLFAFLLENNEARQAVARDDDLREIIMRPIDTDRIDAQIEACIEERDELEAEIERLEEIEQELPALEGKYQEKADELESAQANLQEIQQQIDDLDTDVDESRSRKQELEEAFREVRNARSELEDLEFTLEMERSTLSELDSEHESVERTLADAEELQENSNEIASRIKERRERKRAVEDALNKLGSVISFNEDMLEGDGINISVNGKSDDPTKALVDGGQTDCWTCSSTVDRDQIEGTLTQLRELRNQRLEERSDLRQEIEELSNTQAKVRRERNELERAERRRDELETERETTTERIGELESAIQEQRQVVEELHEAVETIDVEDDEVVLELHREANEIELHIERLEAELAEIEKAIDEHESMIAERADLEAEREDLATRLTDLRTRIDQLEADAVDAFNEHMETMLEILEYDNLERIWIERRNAEVREGRRKVTRTQFDLHIVRSAADGVAYEDTIDHLSESERAVTGLVFALAGHLVHEVHEHVPFVILDSLEAIDADRIGNVLDYFEDHADYLVAALLPEDAEAMSGTYAHIQHIN